MKAILIFIVLGVLIIGCAKPEIGAQPHVTPTPTLETPTPKPANTKHFFKPDIAFIGYNGSWKVLVTFTLPNPCHKMNFVGIERIDDTYILNFNYTPPDPETICIQVLQSYNKTIDLGELESGSYKIVIFVNGIKVEQKELIVR